MLGGVVENIQKKLKKVIIKSIVVCIEQSCIVVADLNFQGHIDTEVWEEGRENQGHQRNAN